MSGGLVALLDDIAAIAKLAAASVDDVAAAAGRASAKAAGVVVDDTAVTPRYVTGVTPERELPIIKKIAIGSLRNKLLFILPAALILSQFLPWLLTPILMVGGTYLSFEGVEKIWEKLSGHGHEVEPEELGDVVLTETDVAAAAGTAALTPPDEAPDAAQVARSHEDAMTAGAIRTDFILSAEIMVIALNEVASEAIVSRAIILAVVAVLITVLVYGVVGLIVKMDDIGLHLSQRGSGATRAIGRGLVAFMPKLLDAISVVGVFAMLWVGGHILLTGFNTLGWHSLYELVHHAEEAVASVAGVGGVLAWIVDTLCSAIVGLVIGGVVVAVMEVVHRVGPGRKAAAAH